GRPVDAALVHRGGPLLHRLLQLRVDREAVRRAGEDVADVLQVGAADTGLGGRAVRRVARLGGGPLQPGVVRRVRAGGAAVAGRVHGGVPVLAGLLGLGEAPLQLRLVVPQGLVGLLGRDVVAADEVLGVELAHAALVVDELVHHRLRHRRVVALVVATAAVADDVDDDVLVEGRAGRVGQLGDARAGLRVVADDGGGRGRD